MVYASLIQLHFDTPAMHLHRVFVAFVVLALLHTVTASKVLVILDSDATKSSHSTFFKNLQGMYSIHVI